MQRIVNIRLEFQKCSYFGRDVGRGRDVAGRVDGREGFPQAPQALILLFICFFILLFYICITDTISEKRWNSHDRHCLTNKWGFVFMGFHKRILIDYKSHKYRQFA